MENPYITTVLAVNVSLLPNQLDNNLDMHLKDNLIKKYEGKCFNEFGYIHKIYGITEKSSGIIIPENPTGSVTYLIRFVCRLCNPIINKQIISKITRLNNYFIKSECGSIIIINNTTKLPSEKFYVNVNKEIFYKDYEKNVKINVGTFLKILVVSKTFSSGDDHIIVIGEIVGIATEDEVNTFYNYEYDNKYS
jgi:DNA-directed RNA polymerase subunit E'/Rpb7